MDRTSWIGVIGCVVLYLAFEFYIKQAYPPVRTAPSIASAPGAPISTPTPPSLTTSPRPSLAPPLPVKPGEPEQTTVLENDFIRVTFSSYGGGIRRIELKKHDAGAESKVTLNTSNRESILERQGWEKEREVYRLNLIDNQVRAFRAFSGGYTLERLYTLSGDYSITVQEKLVNPSVQPLVLPNYDLTVGTSEPIHFHDQPTYQKSNWLLRGETSLHQKLLGDFQGTNILGISFSSSKQHMQEPLQNLQWMTVCNQFFTTILRFPEGVSTVKADWYEIPVELPTRSSSHLKGILARVTLPGQTLAPQSIQQSNFELYTGPKEYSRLKVLGHQEDLVMEFGMWGWVVKPLLWTMHQIHRWVPAYGWVIILLTLSIKIVFFPLQSAANTSMKKMQALAPKMEELKKKHEKDPQKLNTEMLALYKDYGVNPFGGCLPMLVQLPVFFGLYTMLQSAVELRNESFWWIKDLAQPDTIATIPGLGLELNPLPLLMTATSVLLMRMTPQTSDNPHMKMMQWMPVLFLFVLYNFAAALSLYWTVNNVLSMMQTYYNLKAPTPKLQKIKLKNPFKLPNNPKRK